MPSYDVAVVNEDKRPLAGVTVEAVSLDSWPTVSATATTGRAGVAQFTGLTGSHFFRPRVTRVSTTVGGRVYTGAVEIQVIASGDCCLADYVVDPGGGGTHLTLAAAVAAAITAGGDKTIWLCESLTESDIDIGGLGSTDTLTIASHSQHSVVITANASEDIFKQDSTGGQTSGGLQFRNVGFSIPTANYAVYFVNCVSEIANLAFDECAFGGQYLARQVGNTNLLTSLSMRVADCTGSLAGFYDQTHTSQAAPDMLEAYDNDLTLTAWWDGGAGDATPDFFVISGGRYVVTNALNIGSSMTDGLFHNLFIQTSVAAPLFTTGATSINIDDLTFMNLVIRFTNTSGSFGNFGSNAAGNNDSLVITDVFGYIPSDATSAETFLTVDTDWLNPYISSIHAPDWTTVYSGPVITPSVPPVIDHGALTGIGDDDHTQYLLLAGRSGGQYATGRVDLDEGFIRLGMGGHYEFEVVIDGAVGYWRLGEASGSLIDISGNANPGTANGGVTYGVAGAITGDSDTAITLNGTTGYISVLDDDSLDLGDGPFTLEAWIKKAADGTFMSIIAKGETAYQLRMSDGNLLQLLCENVFLIVSSTVTIVGVGWHHVVATKTGATVKLYIDGVDRTGAVTNFTLVDTTDAFHIGRRVAASDEFFNGSVDEVAIYSSVLTAAQVLAHYNAGNSGRGRLSRVSFDAGDHLEFNAASNFFSFIIGDTEYLRLDATALRVDTINELTAAAGVTVDGVLLKDGVVAVGDVDFDDATSDPVAVTATASDGTENSVARKDHGHALGVGTTRGDLLVWDATPVASRLALGAVGTVLIPDGTDPVWSGSPALLGTLTVDIINEYTGAAGVTIEGVQLLDSDILITGSNFLQFRDAQLQILSSADGQLDIDADTEVEITAPTIDLVGAVVISGNLDHDGTNIGFFGTAPVVQAGAYTQTYATADKTHANPTATAPGDLVATEAGWGFYTEAGADTVWQTLDALVADLADIKQLVNAIIDDLQAYGLFQ